jgi:hypothetical protein
MPEQKREQLRRTSSIVALAQMPGQELKRTKKTCKLTDAEIEAKTGISREKHESRNNICNDLPTGKMRIKDPNVDKMLYVDEAGREWRRNPDIFSSYHQPMSLMGAICHSIIDAVIFCVDFPVPNMKFISENEDKTWSEVVCSRYTGELIVDPMYFGTANFCCDCPFGMKTGSLATKQHVNMDVMTHEMYGCGYTYIAKEIPVGYYDSPDHPHPVILHDPQEGPKAIYMSKENDPAWQAKHRTEGGEEQPKEGKKEKKEEPKAAVTH